MTNIHSLYCEDGNLKPVLYLFDNKIFSWAELDEYSKLNDVDFALVKTLHFYREYRGKKDVIAVFDSDGKELCCVSLANSKKSYLFNPIGNSWQERDESLNSLYSEFVKRGISFKGYEEAEEVLTDCVGDEEFKVEFFRLVGGVFDVIKVDGEYYKPFTDGYYMISSEETRDEHGNLVWETNHSSSIFMDLIGWYCKFHEKGIELLDCNIRNIFGLDPVVNLSVANYLSLGMPKRCGTNPFPRNVRPDRTVYFLDGIRFNSWINYIGYCINKNKWPSEGEKLDYFSKYNGKRNVIKKSTPVVGRSFTLYSQIDDKSFYKCDSEESFYLGKMLWRENDGSISDLIAPFAFDIEFAGEEYLADKQEIVNRRRKRQREKRRERFRNHGLFGGKE